MESPHVFDHSNAQQMTIHVRCLGSQYPSVLDLIDPSVVLIAFVATRVFASILTLILFMCGAKFSVVMQVDAVWGLRGYKNWIRCKSCFVLQSMVPDPNIIGDKANGGLRC
jgi:hypothetical protein